MPKIYVLKNETPKLLTYAKNDIKSLYAIVAINDNERKNIPNQSNFLNSRSYITKNKKT